MTESNNIKSFVQDTLVLPTWMLPCLINDNLSGLSNEDEMALDSLNSLLSLRRIGNRASHYSIGNSDSESYFSQYCDVPGYNLACEVADVTITFFIN